MLLTLTSRPTDTEFEFLANVLTPTDQILVSTDSITLALRENEFSAQGLVRKHDLQKIGGRCHSTWKVISDDEWVDATITADKSVTW